MIWLSPIIKFFLPSLKRAAYVLLLVTTFGFCNCFYIWMYLPVVPSCLLIMTSSKFAFFFPGVMLSFFVSNRIFRGRSLTCNGEYKLSNTRTFSILAPNYCDSTITCFFFLMFWFSVSLSITFSWVFLSSWSVSFSSLRILTCSCRNSICSVILCFFVDLIFFFI